MTTVLQIRDAEPPSSSTTFPDLTDVERRLLNRWVILALQSAESAAHRHPTANQLLNRQIEVEEVIFGRRPDLRPLLDELIIWESTLIHGGPGVLPHVCLTCRRAPTTIPTELRRATIGGTR